MSCLFFLSFFSFFCRRAWTMDAPEEDLDIKLQKISGDLIADFDRALPPFLRKPDGAGGTVVRSRVRTRETHRFIASVLAHPLMHHRSVSHHRCSCRVGNSHLVSSSTPSKNSRSCWTLTSRDGCPSSATLSSSTSAPNRHAAPAPPRSRPARRSSTRCVSPSASCSTPFARSAARRLLCAS